jgi:hypothetical protein
VTYLYNHVSYTPQNLIPLQCYNYCLSLSYRKTLAYHRPVTVATVIGRIVDLSSLTKEVTSNYLFVPRKSLAFSPQRITHNQSILAKQLIEAGATHAILPRTEYASLILPPRHRKRLS